MVEKKTVVVQEGPSKGGYEYTVLEAPSVQEYSFEYLKKYDIGNDTYWHGYIKGKEIKEKCFPLDANPRKPAPTRIVRLMQSTIQRTPDLFHHLNNGIAVICNSVSYDENQKIATITFGESTETGGDGICNGGHTYYSINQFGDEIPDDVLVRIELIVLSPLLEKETRAEKIRKIAEARNAHNELESITTAHYSGYYAKFIEHLGSKAVFFKWLEGDPNAVKNAEPVDMLVAKLTALSPHWFDHYLVHRNNQKNHMQAARNQGAVHRRWTEDAANENAERSLYYMIPLLFDILLLKDEISHSLLNDEFREIGPRWRSTRIWQYLKGEGENENKVDLKFKTGFKGYHMSHTFATMVLGAFRHNVWFSIGDNGINYVGWIIDPIRLWHTHKSIFMKTLSQLASTISAPSFGNAFLQNAAAYGYQMTTWEYGASLKDRVCEPEIVYDLQTIPYQKYVRENLPENATHHLNCLKSPHDIAPYAEMVEGAIIESNKSNFVKIII